MNGARAAVAVLLMAAAGLGAGLADRTHHTPKPAPSTSRQHTARSTP